MRYKFTNYGELDCFQAINIANQSHQKALQKRFIIQTSAGTAVDYMSVLYCRKPGTPISFILPFY